MEKLRLSKDSAKLNYEKLIICHQDNNIELAQKVINFKYGLDHYILKEITGFHDSGKQFGWLSNNQKRIDGKNITGFIPETLVTSINTLRAWRNEGTHGNPDNIDYNTYIYLFQIMAKTISFFSDTLIPDQINDILLEHKQTENNPKLTKIMNKNSCAFVNDEILTKVKDGMNIAQVRYIFLKELFIENDSDILICPDIIKITLKTMKDEIISIVNAILQSIKYKQSPKEWIKGDIEHTTEIIKNSIKRKSISGVLFGLFVPTPQPQKININEMKSEFINNYNKNTEWHSLLEKVSKYLLLIDLYNK